MESAVLLVALIMQSAVVAFTRMTSHEGSRARSCGDINNPAAMGKAVTKLYGADVSGYRRSTRPSYYDACHCHISKRSCCYSDQG